jgi:uncharacterized protein (DUF1778 family)
MAISRSSAVEITLRVNTKLYAHVARAAVRSHTTVAQFLSEVVEAEMAARILPTVPPTNAQNYSREACSRKKPSV